MLKLQFITVYKSEENSGKMYLHYWFYSNLFIVNGNCSYSISIETNVSGVFPCLASLGQICVNKFCLSFSCYTYVYF